MGSRGPAPEPDALRRNRPSDQASWTDLPAAGRQGEAPAWPLPRPIRREIALWNALWQRPQAVIWERDGLVEEVAHYVRADVEAERRDAPTPLRKLRDERAKALGLTEDALLRLRWRIVASPSVERAATGTEGPSVKDRFRVVQGGR